MVVCMNARAAKPLKPTPIPNTGKTTNRTATAAIIVAVIGFLVTQVPLFGAFAGSPEDIAAVVLGIVGIVTAVKRGNGKVKAIVATVIAVATLVGIVFGDGTIW
jgi:hypothetical protein